MISHSQPYIPVTQSKCTHHPFFFLLGSREPSLAVLTVAGSVHLQLKSNNMTGPLDRKEKCLSSSEQPTWGPSPILLPPASFSRSVGPQPKHEPAQRAPRGTGRPSTVPEYQPSPLGIYDLHLRSAAFCFYRLQLLFKSKLAQKKTTGQITNLQLVGSRGSDLFRRPASTKLPYWPVKMAVFFVTAALNILNIYANWYSAGKYNIIYPGWAGWTNEYKLTAVTHRWWHMQKRKKKKKRESNTHEPVTQRQEGWKEEGAWWHLHRSRFHSKQLQEYFTLIDAKDRITLLCHTCQVQSLHICFC